MDINIAAEHVGRLADKLEPGTPAKANPVGEGYIVDYAASIAISLKRIADRLDANTQYTYDEPAFRVLRNG